MADSNIKKGKIGNALTSAAPDHVVAVADDVYDEALGKYQSELNQQIGQAGHGTVKGAKVGSGSAISPDENGIVPLPNYETDAQKHKAPTATEVKTALGTNTTHGGAFLRKDGTWVVPPNDNTTYQFEQSGNILKMGTSGGTKSNIYTPTIPTYQNKSAAEGGTDLSLVTTGEKFGWNAKADEDVVNGRLDAQDAKLANIEDSNVTVVADHATVANPNSQIIYREPDSENNPPQYYTDWMYQNGTWTIIKRSTFPGIDQKPIFKSQNFVYSNGVYGVLENSLKNTSYLSESETLSYTENVGFYYDDGPHGNFSGFRYRIYQVRPNKVYTFTSHFGTNTNIPFIYWLDSSQNRIGKEPFEGNGGSGSAPVTYIDQPVVSPSNASYLVLNKNNDADYDANVKAVGDVILNRDLKRQLSGMATDVNAVSRNISISQQDELMAQSTVTGKFIKDDGTEGTSSYFQYMKFAVTGGETYTFSGGFYHANIYYVHWYDANDKHLGHAPYAGLVDAMVRYAEQPVIAPSGAAYALLNVQVTDVSDNVYNFKHVVPQSERLVDLRKDLRAILCRKTELERVDPSEGVGKFYYYDGPRSNQYCRYYKYAVEPKKLYTFSSRLGGNTNIPFVFWLDANENIIGKEPYEGNEGETSDQAVYVDQPIIAPENAAFVIINSSVAGDYEKTVKAVGEPGDFMVMRGVLTSCDLNDVRKAGTWLLADSYTYQNVPDGSNIGFLKVSTMGDWFLQEFYTFSGASLYKRKFATWTTSIEAWTLISGGGGGGTNNYTFNEYSQTVNLTATPSITADTNNYLAPSGNASDRTADILTMLQSNGICRLGAGEYWLDSLVMPDNSSIIGSGTATKVYLKSGDNKFAIKMGKYCVVKDIALYGSTSAISVTETVGTRHGILWSGNYTSQQDGSLQPMYGTVSDVYISRFNGGGITCYDTGYGTRNYISATNVHIENCGAGINISYWSEFHKFTNVRCYGCYYGCINNGGNNMFVNCDFSSCNGIAFLMDNSQGQSPNNSHGSVIGCVFNHTANNTGVGIKILNCNNGFVFSGCQIFFSKIQIEDSAGIEVVSTNFGKNNCDIIVKGGGIILFANNLHQDTPPSISITNNNKVHFVNCYNRANGNLITA